MRPEPDNEAQESIADRIDTKAKAIAEGLGRWKPDEILAEMKCAVPQEGSTADDEFTNEYAKWRSESPL